jgi:hypothetical protein
VLHLPGGKWIGPGTFKLTIVFSRRTFCQPNASSGRRVNGIFEGEPLWSPVAQQQRLTGHKVHSQERKMKMKQAIDLAAVTIRNMFLGGNLASLSLVREPQHMIGYISESLFLFKAVTSRGVPQKAVFEVLPSSGLENITFGNLNSEHHWLGRSASETAGLVTLCLICRLVKPRIVFEIGTLRGYTAFHFALNTPDDARIYSLDLPKDENVRPSLDTSFIDDLDIRRHREAERYCFEKSDVASKITCLSGDSAAFDFSPFAGKVDFFFIDGAHSYEYVRSDTLNAMKCCHPGSVIVWSHFGRMGVNGVSRWILEFSKNHEIYSTPGGSLAFMVVRE